MRSFRREFRTEIEAAYSVLDLLRIVIRSGIMSWFPELATACVLFYRNATTLRSGICCRISVCHLSVCRLSRDHEDVIFIGPVKKYTKMSLPLPQNPNTALGPLGLALKPTLCDMARGEGQLKGINTLRIPTPQSFCDATAPNFQSLYRYNSAADCSISLKYGIEFNHTTSDTLEVFKIKGRRSRSMLNAHQ